MTILNTPQYGVNKNKNLPMTSDRTSRQPSTPYSHGDKHHQRQSFRMNSDNTLTTADQSAAAEIEKMVSEGRQKDITGFFSTWSNIPNRLGDWEIRVNTRRQDNEPVSRTVVALPLTVRARSAFEKGCLKTLENAGFTEEDAMRYYRSAWKKKYVWVDSVISAVKEMVDAFQNVSVLENYELSGDPRRLASTVSVPKNPYLTSHAHFLVAVDMSKCIIKLRVPECSKTDEASSEPDHEVNNSAAPVTVFIS